MQALELLIKGKEITLINIYGPNDDDKTICNSLEDYINMNQETHSSYEETSTP